MKKRVTGIGGLFMKCDDPKKQQEWYHKHLGIAPSDDGTYTASVFDWKDKDTQQWGHTVWGLFKEQTTYFQPGKKDFMFNYRVENLEELLKQLKEEGVQVVGEMEVYQYGKFAWIMDPEGNKIELWEPNDEVFRNVNKLD